VTVTAARGLLDALKSEGIDHVFLVPGGSVDMFLPELERAGITPVVAAHEAGAAFMADGYGRARGLFGVCMAIAGPGVTNMMTALAAAYADRAPLLLLTGSLPFAWRGREAFQDATPSGLSDVELVRPVTLFAEEVPTAAMAGATLRRAIRAMLGVRRGPAFLALPEEMQTVPVSGQYRPVASSMRSRPLDRPALEAATANLGGKTRIAIHAGNGCVSSDAALALRRFAEAYHLPVVTTLRAKGVLAEDHPLSLGVFGVGGSLHARALFHGEPLDGLFVVGARLNEYNTMWSPRFEPRGPLVQIDTDPGAMGHNDYAVIPVVGDARAAFAWLAESPDVARALGPTRARREAWVTEIRRGPRHESPESRTSAAVPLHPARVMAELSAAAPRECVTLVDSGAHTFFAGHHWESHGPRQWLLTTTMGPMGWALGAAVGARLARPDAPCLVITGDGCLLMHGFEIRTAVRRELPIVYVVIDNEVLASVYLRAMKIDPAGVPTTMLGRVDWVAFARSVGADGERVERPEDLAPAFARAFAAGRPFVVSVACDPDAPTPSTSSEV